MKVVLVKSVKYFIVCLLGVCLTVMSLFLLLPLLLQNFDDELAYFFNLDHLEISNVSYPTSSAWYFNLSLEKKLANTKIQLTQSKVALNYKLADIFQGVAQQLIMRDVVLNIENQSADKNTSFVWSDIPELLQPLLQSLPVIPIHKMVVQAGVLPFILTPNKDTQLKIKPKMTIEQTSQKQYFIQISSHVDLELDNMHHVSGEIQVDAVAKHHHFTLKTNINNAQWRIKPSQHSALQSNRGHQQNIKPAVVYLPRSYVDLSMQYDHQQWHVNHQGKAEIQFSLQNNTRSQIMLGHYRQKFNIKSSSEWLKDADFNLILPIELMLNNQKMEQAKAKLDLKISQNKKGDFKIELLAKDKLSVNLNQHELKKWLPAYLFQESKDHFTWQSKTILKQAQWGQLSALLDFIFHPLQDQQQLLIKPATKLLWQISANQLMALFEKKNKGSLKQWIQSVAAFSSHHQCDIHTLSSGQLEANFEVQAKNTQHGVMVSFLPQSLFLLKPHPDKIKPYIKHDQLLTFMKNKSITINPFNASFLVSSTDDLINIKEMGDISMAIGTSKDPLQIKMKVKEMKMLWSEIAEPIQTQLRLDLTTSLSKVPFRYQNYLVADGLLSISHVIDFQHQNRLLKMKNKGALIIKSIQQLDTKNKIAREIKNIAMKFSQDQSEWDLLTKDLILKSQINLRLQPLMIDDYQLKSQWSAESSEMIGRLKFQDKQLELTTSLDLNHVMIEKTGQYQVMAENISLAPVSLTLKKQNTLLVPFNVKNISLVDLSNSKKPLSMSQLSLTGNAHLSRNILKADVLMGYDTYSLGSFSTQMDTAKMNGKLSIDFKTPDFKQFNNGLNGIVVNSASLGNITAGQGWIKGQVDYQLTEKKPTGWNSLGSIAVKPDNLMVGITNMHANFDTFEMHQVNSKIKMTSLYPLKTDEHQRLTISSLGSKVKMHNLSLDYTIAHDNSAPLMNIHSFSTRFLGGDISIDDAVISAQMKESFNVNFNNIDLSRVIQLTEQENIYAEGKLKGYLPVKFNQNGFVIEKGLALNIAPGIIRYQPESALNQALEQQNQYSKFVFDALKNFHFDQLEAGINYGLSKEADIEAKFKGKNPDFYKGHAINLNLNMSHNNIDILLLGALAGQRVVEMIENKFEQ